MTLRRPLPSTKKPPGRRTRPSDRGGVDRRAVLDAASRVIAEEGARALTMRRLANEIGASTMVLYARFSNREALLDALLAEGFSRFAEALSCVNDPDADMNLRELGRAYRRFARENPNYYGLMWSPRGSSKSVVPVSALHAQHGQRAFGSLLIAVTRVLAAEDRPAREAEPFALSIWSLVHGFCSLELSGAMPSSEADAAYEATLDFAVKGLHRR